MTTPPIPPAASPDGPGEPANVWAPPTSPPAHPPRTGLVHPALIHPPSFVPPRRTSRVGLVIASCLGVLLVAMLATVFYLFPEGHGTAVGDCVKLTGVESNMKYDEVSCDGRLHNYTVSKVLDFDFQECGGDPDAYTTYNGREGTLCLIPVFFDGQCYDFMLASLTAENPVVDCGATGAIKVRVLTNTADEAACGADSLKAMAYEETKTTYCFTPGS
ncbi:LppU/SCO3897 family protein [Lentzea sp. HUAS TT2]|uniref:LppU/SCO3897 family protein n=1 Tax=Lentzea sp. HUAS TT2 TaxID=3447454 RepID=UPI003F729E61